MNNGPHNIGRDRERDNEVAQGRQQRAVLLEELARFEERARPIRHGLRAIPERKQEMFSPGICATMECVFCREPGAHYSDSCPDFTDGDQRYQIVKNLKRMDNGPHNIGRDRERDNEVAQGRQQRAVLLEELARFEERARPIRHGLRAIPERKQEMFSPGICATMECVFCREPGAHYSDSCPDFTDGDQRYQIVKNRKRCPLCMEHCERRGYCAYIDKKCFYCTRARNTIFEQHRPRDNGHHTALCTIPERMEEARVELNRIEQEIQTCKWILQDL
ncbi:unnamed protein product [Heligmosomoides polygyrus]|uniref:CCHC-type domain-containing protein n=1 Tax=Heligmosomoides polygyrus TaxID=6339 RepID=A0A183FWU9_HELPZ|nr:unnamed protein product [Heligmosomoides polygyrus]